MSMDNTISTAATTNMGGIQVLKLACIMKDCCFKHLYFCHLIVITNIQIFSSMYRFNDLICVFAWFMNTFIYLWADQ